MDAPTCRARAHIGEVDLRRNGRFTARMQCDACLRAVGRAIPLEQVAHGLSLPLWLRRVAVHPIPKKTQRWRPSRRRQNYRRFLNSAWWKRQRQRVFERDNWTCHWCRQQLEPEECTGDHLAYPDRRGPYTRFREIPDRLVVCACGPCNSARGRDRWMSGERA